MLSKQLKTVYQWSSVLTLEQSLTDIDSYLWTQETKALLDRIRLLEGQLLAVTGLQGSGKSILKQRLAYTLGSEFGDDKVLSVKWESKEKLLKQFKPKVDIQDICDMLLYDLQEKLGFDGAYQWISERFHGHAEDLRKGECSEKLMRIGFIEAARSKLGLKSSMSPEDKLSELAGCKVLLIEFPDYSKKTLALFNKHLNDFQRFWEHLRNESLEAGAGSGARPFNLNIVLFFQKEMFAGHFLFRKFSHFDIRKFTPQELYGYYIQRFKEPAPFTKKALMEIASLSRGIFRRFKNYITICLERSGFEKVISLKNVKDWITLDQIVKDMELELRELFPKSREHRRNSVILLQFLREHNGKASQQEIIKLLNITEMSTGRLVQKLEAYGYLKIKRVGRENTIQLIDNLKAPCSI